MAIVFIVLLSHLKTIKRWICKHKKI